jgi:hypothetical protein
MKTYLLLFTALLLSAYSFAQQIPARWDELVASDFPAALENRQKPVSCPLASWKNTARTPLSVPISSMYGNGPPMLLNRNTL